MHDNLRISFALNRLVYPVNIATTSIVSEIYLCLSNPHIPYLKANSIFRKSCDISMHEQNEVDLS